MGSRRLPQPRGLIDALPASLVRGDRGRPPEGRGAAGAPPAGAMTGGGGGAAAPTPAWSDDESTLSSGTLHVTARLPFPRHLWLDRPGTSVDVLIRKGGGGGGRGGGGARPGGRGGGGGAAAAAGGSASGSSMLSAHAAADASSASAPAGAAAGSSRRPPLDSLDVMEPPAAPVPPPPPPTPPAPVPSARATAARVGGGAGAVAAAVAAAAAAADRPAAWAPARNGRGPESIPQIGEETIPVMGLSEMVYLRNLFMEVDAAGRGWVDYAQFTELCDLLLTRGVSSSAVGATSSSEEPSTDLADGSFDGHTAAFQFRLCDSGRQDRVTLHDWIRACAVFCYGRLPHKLPFLFRFAADEVDGVLSLSEAAIKMLIHSVFTVVCTPPGHAWNLARTPVPPGRWPPSHYASGALSVEHNPDTLWASAQRLIGPDGRMSYAAYLTWAEHEPSFSEWVGWVGSRGLRAINVVQSAKERAQFVAEMEKLGFAATQLAALPVSAAAAAQMSTGLHPSSTTGSSNRGDSLAGQSSVGLLSSFEIDYKTLSLERMVGEGTFAEVWAGRWLEAPVAVKIFKDRSSAAAMYQVAKHRASEKDAASASPRGSTAGSPPSAAEVDDKPGLGEAAAGSPASGSLSSELSDSAASPRSASGNWGFFLREVELLSNLRHPNILLYMGACVRQSSPLCIVSELVTGGSLHDALHGGPGRRRLHLTPLMKLRVSLDVARGMLYLHSLSPMLLHRDLKTSNILVDTGDALATQTPSRVRAVLCDFGLSRLDAAGTHQSASGERTALVGSLVTMAPEIVRSERYSSAADVFSFAMVLWELWTGQVPYKGLMPAQLMFEVAIKGARPNVGPSSGVPATVAELIRHCWQADLKQRPRFLEIVQRLQGFARDEMGVTV